MSKKIWLVLFGLLGGFANGLLGAGGGIIFILVLEKFFKLEEKKSHATTVAIILPLCVLSTIIMAKNCKLDWHMIFFISLGGTFGGVIGAKLLNKISNIYLKKIFGLFMIIAAVKMIL